MESTLFSLSELMRNLEQAIKKHNKSSLSKLLTLHTNPNIKEELVNRCLWQAISKSIESYNLDIVQLLLTHNANPNIQNENKNNPLQYILLTTQVEYDELGEQVKNLLRRIQT